jgi:hypothetical protein
VAVVRFKVGHTGAAYKSLATPRIRDLRPTPADLPHGDGLKLENFRSKTLFILSITERRARIFVKSS